ncbi:MAG: SDR family oxidoreductase, partial [Chloroflexi bacterium]|nr:SDR family oxidoreductase [Chloroflexota bacterium]
RGADVRVLDDFSTGQRENLAHVAGHFELVEGDLRELDAVRRAAQGVEVVLHQAALSSVARSVEDPVGTNAVNVTGTLNLLVAARDAGVRRLVYASSSSVYGDSPVMPKVETMPVAPKSPYAVAKLTGELYARVFAQLYDLETVSLRYFNVFGPRQDPMSQYSAVIPIFITAMLRGEQPPVEDDGLQSRDFTYVANNVHTNLLAATAPGVSGEVFNVACGKRVNLLELIGLLNGILGTDLQPTFKAPRPGDVKHSLADVDKAQTLLGYETVVDWEEGLRRTVEWYREQAH